MEMVHSYRRRGIVPSGYNLSERKKGLPVVAGGPFLVVAGFKGLAGRGCSEGESLGGMKKYAVFLHISKSFFTFVVEMI